jgi:hypothetical protein
MNVYEKYIWNEEVGFDKCDECLCECYTSIWNLELGYDKCLCKYYMNILK